MIAKTPTGKLIVGTCETVEAMACTVAASFKLDPATGKLSYDHEGDSEVYWDSMATKTTDKDETLFQDEDGGEWPESSLVLSEE